ncbi:SRPBCC domain-containing protein [Raineyella fluvialis]|uniref:Toxin n=1 Tax=Raineyella fluvialis TaxID=2662261 RepID=A0A5Q2FCP9_9ACTN|nr:SRPBCC domain-containing protein [Raineyella fluvialis]QGF23204.1 toxin [Raineyella fluvialis]
MSDPATFIEVDERAAVRFVRRYRLSGARVWEAVTAPEHLARWFPSPEVTYEPRVGAEIGFAGDPHLPTFRGTVLTWDPPRRFAFSWGGDEVRFDVEPDGEGTGDGDGATLTLTDLLDQPGAAARNAAGWEACLRSLDALLAGQATVGPHVDEEAGIWREAYDRYVASGFPPMPRCPTCEPRQICEVRQRTATGAFW